MAKNNSVLNDLILGRNVSEIIDKSSLIKKLGGPTPLRIKLGVDPTSPDLHLGHAVSLWKLKQFQDAGHTIIFLIGDYTSKIGDPSGRNTTRPVLSDEAIEQNAKTYLEQVGKILDVSKCEIRRNGEWFAAMDLAQVIQLLAHVTITQVTEREDFTQRAKQGGEVGLHEALYSVMQGYDSVQLKADVELGGVDQKLNLLMGRDLQRKFNQPEQDIMIVPLLLGIDGVKKMSKSLGNYIGIAEPAAVQFGKIMSIPDSLMLDYWKLCTNLSDKELADMAQELKSGTNPRDIKIRLAKTIVAMYHDAVAADTAEADFIKTFQKGELPDDMPMMQVTPKPTTLVDLLVITKLVDSKSEARRMVEQKAVKIDQQLVTEPDQQINPIAGMVLSVGKRKFVKLQ
ncbi:MAG: tyrosine--tRNA ligase [Patescibacteria group bacterium]|jgi:tyrosyl-tRNA synthetase